jgi:hypothetical protein
MFIDDDIHRLVVALMPHPAFADKDPSLLGTSLLIMNEAAVNASYNESSKRNAPYVWQAPPVFSVAQAFKTIRCFLYQCSEGDVPDTWRLFAEVDAVRAWYAELLGCSTDERGLDKWKSAALAADYQAASWS